MNSIHGIIHDLADEETVIGGCTTAGEVIIALQGFIEQNNLFKEKLEKIEQIVNCELIAGRRNYKSCYNAFYEIVDVIQEMKGNKV